MIKPMQKPASTMNQDDNDNPQAGRRPLKFSYSSGSQPLSGYTIKRGIGVGGFGDVYYATSDGGKEVALKRIQRNLDIELRGVRQCLNLKHPNLVALFDIRYDDQEQAWVVMEYVAGDSLGHVIERNPNGMPEEEVHRWFKGIAKGVGYLHDHGIVHRDLKPGNIFIDHDIVKIGDYGLSKFISCSQRSGQTESVGTFHYMAPEIGLGRYGKEIDIYALGILLFEMLTGQVPFEGESSQEIIMKHLTAEPNLDRLNSHYRTIVSKALSKDPAKRFQSVNEMVQALGIAESSDRPVKRAPIIADVVGEATAATNVEDSAANEPEEPIARYVHAQLQDLKAWWQDAETNSPVLAITIAMAAVMLFLSAGWLIPVGFMLLVCYGIYYLIWSILTPSHSSSSSVVKDVGKTTHGTKPAISPQRRRRSRYVTRQALNERYRDWLGEKKWGQKSTELVGSMLMACIVSVVMSLLVMIPTSQRLNGNFYSWGPLFAWQCITSVVGAWTILACAKFWESSTGDQALRRFFMLASGLGVGAFAGILAQFLMLQPNYLPVFQDTSVGYFLNQYPLLYDSTGNPGIMAYLGYFGGLFLILRWWLNADPLRSSRLGIMATFLTVAAAFVLHIIIPIPRGFLVAATIAVTVQLSAPWVNSRQRKQLKEEFVQQSRPIRNV